MKQTYLLDKEEILEMIKSYMDAGIPCHRTQIPKETQEAINANLKAIYDNLICYFNEGEIL